MHRLRGILSGSVFLLFFFLTTMAPPACSASEKDQSVSLNEYLSVEIKTQRLIGSHTSYEFGNPFPPYQTPLSRLEFPMDSWWVGAGLRAAFPRFSLGVEALTNASREMDGRMKDSDWDDDTQPKVKTIYSESDCRMESSYMLKADIDLKVSDWLGLPEWIDLRPVAGFRLQNFTFVSHDGMQLDLTGATPPLPLPGDGIRFEQIYRQYFLGARAGFELGKYARLKSLTALLQFDWAYVEGSNRDHHLLRTGNRYTMEETTGDAWHGSIGFRAGLSRHFSLSLDADFLAISTTGSHRLLNPLYDIDFKFSHGVRVWSNQNSLAMTLRYVF